MADAVSTKVLYESKQLLVIKCLNLSDGTGESNVVKVDKSAYTSEDGSEPGHFLIEKIQYDVAGMSVLISVDHTSDTNLFRLAGHGEFCYKKFGGISTSGTGDTGDILFTTNGHTSGDTYDITLWLRKGA